MQKDIWKVFSTNLIKMGSTLLATLIIPMVLTLDEYSYYKVYGLYAAYIGVLHLGYCDGVFIEYGGKKLEEFNTKKIASEYRTILCFCLLNTFIISCAGLCLDNYIIILVGLNVFPIIMMNFFTAVYQAVGNMNLYSRIYKMNAFSNLIVSVICLFFFKIYNAKALIISQTISNYFVALYSIYLYQKINNIRNKGKFEFIILKKFIFSGILLMLGNMSYILFQSIDKWTIQFVMPDNNFAQYSFAVQLLSVLNMFASPIGLTCFSYMARKKDKNYELKLKRIIIAILLFMLTGVFILRYIISQFIVKYVESLFAMEILFLSQVFSLLNTIIYVNLFKAYKMQRIYMKNLIYTIVCSIFLNIIYINILGYNIRNVALATLTSMLIWSILNLKHFTYLKLSKNDYVFIVICIIGYLNCCVFNELGLKSVLIYLLIWSISAYIWERDVFILCFNQVRKLVKL